MSVDEIRIKYLRYRSWPFSNELRLGKKFVENKDDMMGMVNHIRRNESMKEMLWWKMETKVEIFDEKEKC